MKPIQEEQIERIKKVYGSKTDVAMADALGISKGTISSWKKRGGVPTDVFKRVASDKGVSMDWLINGSGSMYKNDLDTIIEDITLIDAAMSDREKLCILTHIAKDEKAFEAIKLLRYAPSEFMDHLIKRLEEFKNLSSI